MIRLRSFRESASQNDRDEAKHTKNKPQGRVSAITNFLVTSDRTKAAVARFPIGKSKTNHSEGTGGVRVDNNFRDQPILKKKGDESATAPTKTNTVKKWMRRVLPKEKGGKSGLFPRIPKKSKATKYDGNFPKTINACGRTVTDESSSKLSRSRNDDSPREIMLPGAFSSFCNIIRSIETNHHAISSSTIRVVDKREKDNIFFEDDYEDDMFGNKEEEEIFSIAPENIEGIQQRAAQSHHRKKGLNSTTEIEGDDAIIQHETQKVLEQKADIMNKLFPLGHPSDRQTCDEPGPVVTEDYCTSKEDLECNVMRKSSFHRADVIRSLFPFGHPDDRKKKGHEQKHNIVAQSSEQKENTSFSIHGKKIHLFHEAKSALLQVTSRALSDEQLDETVLFTDDFEDDLDPTGAEKDGQHECDKFIGMIITFDPTWDLLAPEDIDSTIGAPRSRLKKLHKFENYADSLLGKFAAEESSAESIDLIADANLSFDTEPASSRDLALSVTSVASDSFKLGFHFDEKRFPMVEPHNEIEICFYPDEVSSEFITEETATSSSAVFCTEEKSSQPRAQMEIHRHPGERTEIIFRPRESNCGRQMDKVGNNDCCGTTCYDEFTDCIEYEQNIHDPLRSPVQSPLQIFESSPEINFLPPISIPQQPFVIGKLMMPRNGTKVTLERSPCPRIEAKITTEGLQETPDTNECGAPFSTPSTTSSYHSTKSSDPSVEQEEHNDTTTFFFHAISQVNR